MTDLPTGEVKLGWLPLWKLLNVREICHRNYFFPSFVAPECIPLPINAFSVEATNRNFFYFSLHVFHFYKLITPLLLYLLV